MSERILKVGAAKLSISPTPDMLPIPLSFSGDQYEAVREGEELSVRAIVVDNGQTRFLFEAFELGGIPNQEYLYKHIGERYGFTSEQMLLTGTHNHAAPFPHDPNKFNKYRQKDDTTENTLKFTELVLKNSVDVVGLAIENMRPAKFGFGEDKSYININRDQLFDDGYWMQGKNFEGCSDKTLAALTFVDYDGNLIAAVLNYAMHDVMNFCAKDADGKVKITCGVPGIACNFLERYYGNDAVVLWQSGAAGNQNPVLAYGCRYDINGTMYAASDLKVPGASYADAIMVGEQHAMDAIRAINKAKANRQYANISTQETVLYFPGQKFPEDVDPMYHRLMVDNILVSRGYFKPGEKYEKKLVDMIPVDEKVPMKAQLVLFGDVAFYGVACELYNEIGVLCKEASPYRKTVVATHVGSPSAGYVLDDASKGRKVFQAFGQVREGESNAIVVNGMLDMFDKALGQI